MSKVKEWCSRHKLPYRKLDQESLNKVASSVHHEGAVMVVKPLKQPSVHDWVKAGLAKHQFALALDRVENSHNVGAILRSCAYFGAEGLLVGLGENATAVNSSAVRMAEGALEIVSIEEPVMAWASVTPLELSVGNLVRNAIEASAPDGTVRLTLDADAQWAEIAIEDSGPGLPDDVRQKVFEPFFTTKSERGGTGLGLSITRDMIGQLGGEVGLVNLDRGGARATIRLQRWQEPEPSS